MFYFPERRCPFMTAYVVVDINVTDPASYEEYKKLAAPTVELYGGKYIARAGRTETLEGNWSPTRLVILQFDSIEQAKTWLNSPEYSEVKKIRHRTATSNMVVIEGV
jgi:uncharacterized protein (DUF1330 family)